MHDCLKIQEIVTNIFQHISQHLGSPELCYWPRLGSSTLAGLARTCKVFAEPVLDNLWYYQTSLVPLILCLPPDAIKIETKEPYNTLMRVTRDLRPADYDRILYYGRKIRVLDLSSPVNYRSPGFDPLILPLVWSNRPAPGFLLPMLSHLELPLTQFDDLALSVRFAVGPRLRSISIEIEIWEYRDGETAYPWDNVAYVLKSAPGITMFAIKGKDNFPDDQDFEEPLPLMQLYDSLNHLECLDTRPIYLTHGVLSHLVAASRLKRLMFTIHSEELMQFNATTPHEIDFPCLTNLWIGIEDLFSCMAFLTRPGYRKLETLEIMHLDDSDNDEIDGWDLLEPFFASLRDHLPHSNLRSLCILGCGYYTLPLQHTVSRITLSTLSPLFSFSNLSDVQITLDASFKLSNADLRDIATAWPNLRILRFFERTTTRRPKVTLLGLLFLIKLCPQLQELTLRVNAWEIPRCAELGDVRGLNLRSLDVCTSPLFCVSGMAAFLISTFPQLSSLSFGWVYWNQWDVKVDMQLTSDDEEHLECWKEVRAILRPVTEDRGRQQRYQK